MKAKLLAILIPLASTSAALADNIVFPPGGSSNAVVPYGWFPTTCGNVGGDLNNIQAQVNRATAAGGGIVTLPSGSCIINGNIVPTANTWLLGAGQGATVLTETLSGSAIVKIDGHVTRVANVTISDMSLNENGIDTAIYVEGVDHFAVRRVAITNPHGWGILACLTDATVSTIANTFLTIEDVNINNPQGTTLGAIGLCNAYHVYMNRVHIDGVTKTSPGIELYQNLNDVLIENTVLENLSQGSYYSQSVNNVTYRNVWFSNNTEGLQGANQSDNGNFGALVATNLIVDGCYITGTTDIALQLGALQGFAINDTKIYANMGNAVVFSKGNATGPGPAPNALAVNGNISNTQIYDNNLAVGSALGHPGILFENLGGILNLSMSNVQIYDDQGTPTQTNAMVFSGALSWTNVSIFGGQLAAYSGGSSIITAGGATLSAINTYGVMNLGGISAGVTSH